MGRLLSFVGLAIELSIAGSHAAEEAGFPYPRRALKAFLSSKPAKEIAMIVWRRIYVGTLLVLSLVVGLRVAADDRDDFRDAKIAPRLKVDTSWPKPLPNN